MAWPSVQERLSGKPRSGSVVEQGFNPPKQFWALNTRYAKYAARSGTEIALVAIAI